MSNWENEKMPASRSISAMPITTIRSRSASAINDRIIG